MPRLPRVYIENSVYYVTCKGLQNQVIFKDARDYEMYFELLKKYKEQYAVKLYAYTLMHNHLHLLMEVDKEASISTIMHDLTSSYTKYFNGRYDRKGHLFRERFKAAVVEKNPQILLDLTAYIHLNPKRLNLGIQGRTYPYSSYELYLDYSPKSDRGLAIKNEIESIVNKLVGENYVEFMNRMQDNAEFQKNYKKLQRKGMIGSGEFMSRVKEAIEQQRSEPEEPELEEKILHSKNVLMNTGVAVLLLSISAGGVYLYFNYANKVLDKPQIPVATVELQLKDLNNTEWQVEMFNMDGSLARADILSFMQGKFSSAYLSQFEFPHINYSVVFEGNKIIWETMQTSATGTASWRGEVVDGEMLGMVSLRQEGKEPQDFSFKSLKYRRR
ncbi:MAG: transposase [Candidatus Omnitrophota bacterium]